MADLPDPLVPPDVDLRDFAFMPLDVRRLRDSDTAAIDDPEAFRAAVMLWCASWHSIPAASVPDDDLLLCRLAGYGRDMKTWTKARDNGALRGFIKCSDGRLYHHVIADKALDAWSRKEGYRSRMEQARIAKQQRKQQGEHGVNGTLNNSVNDRAITGHVIGHVDRPIDRSVDLHKGQVQGQVQREVSPQPPRGPKSMIGSPECLAFYRAYPRHDAPDDAFKAWQQVTKAGAKPADIMAGLARYQFSADPQFVKLPASWLRAGCWKSEPTLLPNDKLDPNLVSPLNPQGRRPTPMTGGF